jgi:hypothetical protein
VLAGAFGLALACKDIIEGVTAFRDKRTPSGRCDDKDDTDQTGLRVTDS